MVPHPPLKVSRRPPPTNVGGEDPRDLKQAIQEPRQVRCVARGI